MSNNIVTVLQWCASTKQLVQTIAGKGWNPMLRLYGPLEPWFDKTWRPSANLSASLSLADSKHRQLVTSSRDVLLTR